MPSYSLLNEIMTSQIISKNPEVMRMVSEALLFHSNDKVFLQPLQEGKHFQPRGEQMLALIKSTTRREGQSYRTEDTKLHMIRGTGDKPFHMEVSEQLLPMTLDPYSLCVVTKGNYLFLFGADAKYFRPMAVRFDVKTNTWLDLKPPPYKTSIGIAATLLKDNIYLLGGFDLTEECNLKVNPNHLSECASQYSIETNTWSKMQNLPKHLGFHSAAAHGKYVFCAGGCSRNAFSTDKLYAFDVVGKIWLTKASMNNQRVNFSLEVVGAKLIACGSRDLPNVEIYDITDDQWTLIQNGVLEHNLFPATIVMNKKVYIIGGSARDEDDRKSMTDYVSSVDVDNAMVHKVSSLPFPVQHHASALLTVPNTTLPRPQSE